MKQFLNLMYAFLFLLTTNGLIFAQDFIVEIELTDDHSNYFKPLKAGSKLDFKISVTNNRQDTCTVSIVKNAMGVVSSWISIANNSQEIFTAKTKIFNLTIDVPEDACDCDFFLHLNFDAYDKNYINHPFQYDDQIITIDNSKPIPPTFYISQTNKTVTVHTWSSWDARSSSYDFENGGIETFLIVLKKPDDNILGSESYLVSEDRSHEFKSLTPNTDYRASVTAFDLAGNSNTFEKLATTSPADPTMLDFLNTTYISTILTWNVSPGASGYDIYKVTDGPIHTRINSSPVTENAYLIENLDPNTKYTYNVIALSNVGPSGRSTNAEVTTLALPNITGSFVCSGGSTIALDNLVSGYTVSWDPSSNAQFQSQSGSSAVFIGISDGTGWIDASIIAPNERVLELKRKDIWVGNPQIMSEVPLAYTSSGSYNTVCLYQTYKTSMNVVGAPELTYATWSRVAASDAGTTWYQTANDVSFYFDAVNQTATYRISASNSCGAKSYDFSFKCISCGPSPCNPSYSMAPNPARNSTVIIYRKAPCPDIYPASRISTFNGHIAIYDNRGVLKKKINYKKYENVELDLSGLKNGLHHIEIYDGQSIQNKTIIIRK